MDVYDRSTGDFIKQETVVSGSNLRYSVHLHTGRRRYHVVGWFEDESDALDWIRRQVLIHPNFVFSFHSSLF